MNKSLLLTTVVFFLAQCNTAHEQKPDAERAIKDTFAQSIMQPFNTRPVAQKLYIKFEPKDKNIPSEQSPAILQLLSGLKSQPQHFIITASEQNELQGEAGTKIIIEPNSFATISGKEISSAVNIELKECYALNEMLEENLTSTNNGSLLESMGAVFVSANCNGEALKPKEGQKINIEFPFAVSESDGYAFYYGNQKQNNIDWQPVIKNETSAQAKSNVCNPEFSYKGYNLKEYLTSQLEYTDEARRNELSANVEVSFVVDKNGKVKEVNCVSAYKTFRDEIVATLEHMPKWKPAAYGKKKINAQVKLNVDFNLRRKEQVLVLLNSSNITPVANNSNDNSTNAVYSQTFDQLGWVSYSHMLTTTNTNADVVIGSNQNTDVKIVLKNRNAIIGGGHYLGYCRFNNIPAGEEVYVIAVRYENENIFYAVQPLTLEKQTVVLLNWKKGTEADIKKAFRNLS